MKFSLPVLILLAFSLCTSAGNAQEEWRVDPDFRGKKARKDISGAVCNPVRCIAVNDETNYAQAFSVGKNRIKPGKRIVLAEKGDEIDAEAIAYSGGTFYIAGSHGVSRKKGKERDASYQVFRVEGDDITVSGRLRGVIERVPELKKYASKRLNKNGVNIEGIAARGDRLFFGFRGPSVKGQAYILETSAKTLFSDELIAPTLHRLSLGDRIGIRDMVAVNDGVLILTGPVNKLPRRYTVAFWKDGGSEPVVLAKVPLPTKGKPEGVLVLNESRNHYNLLIFNDGPRNGGPFQLRVSKP